MGAYYASKSNNSEGSATEPQTTRLVGAGLAVPLWYIRGMERGQGKPSPYETPKMFAKKTRIHELAVQDFSADFVAG